MAKSIRSKQKRRMRAIKRVRYGEKELNRLEEMVEKNIKSELEKAVEIGNSMEIETSKTNTLQAGESERNKKTLLDKNGHYPEWMSGKRLKKQKKIVKRLKKSKK